MTTGEAHRRSGWTRRRVLLGMGAAAALPIAATKAVAASSNAAVGSSAAAAVVQPSNQVEGAGLPMFGFDFAHYFDGGNTSSWMRYARVNSGRNFTGPTLWIPADDLDDGSNVSDLASFDAAKDELRADPEGTTYINWPAILDRYENLVHPTTNIYTLNYLFGEASRLGLDMVVEMDLKQGWLLDWPDLWRSWQRCYAHAYHIAKTFGMRRFSVINEPDVPHTAEYIPTMDDYLRALRFGSDAIRSAVEDAAAARGTAMTALIHAPVITRSTMVDQGQGGSGSITTTNLDANTAADGYYGGDDRDDEVGWGQSALRGMRIDYRGDEVDYNVFDVYDCHSYNQPPSWYPDEIATIREKLDAYAAADTELPIVYSEINRHNTWWFGQSSKTLDTPEVAREVAAIAANCTTSEVEGLLFFKFMNARDAEGNPQGTGFYYVDAEEPYDVRAATRSAETLRMFGRGFVGDVERLATSVDGAPDDFSVWCSYDEASRCYYALTTKHFSGSAEFQLDMSGLTPGPATDVDITVEEVSSTYAGGISRQLTVPSSKVVSLTQPGWTMWLLTIPANGVEERPPMIAAKNALVRSGADADANFGAREGLAVQRKSGANEVTYLGFDPVGEGDLVRATLQVYAHVPTGANVCTFGVFALPDGRWGENGLTWNSASYLSASDSLLERAGNDLLPAGQMTVTETFTYARLDVTDIVAAHPDVPLTFVLIKQPRFDDDNDQDDRRVTLIPRQYDQRHARPRLRIWTAT